MILSILIFKVGIKFGKKYLWQNYGTLWCLYRFSFVKFYRRSSKKNARSLLEKRKIGQSTQLWSLSSDSNEYGRNLNLLSGRLKNILTPEGINEQTLRAGLSNLSVKDRVEVIHDGSDIRKPYSKLLPHLTKVKSLEKQMVNRDYVN